MDGDGSKASDWDALPKDFKVSNYSKDRVSMFESDSDMPYKAKIVRMDESRLDYSVPDANQNSKEHSKWKEDESVLFKESDRKLTLNQKKPVEAKDESIDWEFNF